MLKWSTYNLVFRSKKFGLMLYNSLSNRLMVIKPEFEKEIEKIEADPISYDFSGCLSLFMQMIKNRVLVGEKTEQDLVDALKKKNRAARYDRSKLDLTILVTEDCNFGCPYCYEKNKRSVDMSPATMDRLMEFIKGFAPLQQLNVVWFGGEPLLRFDIIRELIRRFQVLDIPYKSAIITNGWLLTETMTAALDELNVDMIQVTIDGPPDIHNKKRFHLVHGDSFDVIRANLDRLIWAEKWPGRLKLNYIVDETKAPFYEETFDYWTERYKGGNVQFGATFADSTERGSRNMGCAFDRTQEIGFYLDHYRTHQGKGLRYFPRKLLAGCCATHQNAFVVGAEGQLYKCWDDVGKKEMEIGDIYSTPEDLQGNVVSARYLNCVDPFDNPSCSRCFYLPICNGCPNMQYRKQYNGQNINTCTNFKKRLPEFLEIHHEMREKKRLSNQGDGRLPGAEPASL